MPLRVRPHAGGRGADVVDDARVEFVAARRSRAARPSATPHCRPQREPVAERGRGAEQDAGRLIQDVGPSTTPNSRAAVRRILPDYNIAPAGVTAASRRQGCRHAGPPSRAVRPGAHRPPSPGPGRRAGHPVRRRGRVRRVPPAAGRAVGGPARISTGRSSNGSCGTSTPAGRTWWSRTRLVQGRRVRRPAPGIVPPELFTEAARVLARNRVRRGNRRGTTPTCICSGGCCGAGHAGRS